MKTVELPCGCGVDVDPVSFPSGERGASCPRHERSFIITAHTPKYVTHKVTRETRYEKKKDG